MTQAVVNFPPSPRRLRCESCGATAKAACDCGAPYMPPLKLALKALANDDKRTNKAIAEELAIGEETVRRARNEHFPPNEGVASRVAQPSVALADDFLSPADADRTIRTIAQYLNGALLNPPSGIRACLAEAMTRASPASVKAITVAADFLTELRIASK
jgi:hypothetical protein